MNKTDLQRLAEERLGDVRLLFANGRCGAAYYLAGYVIECGLKACIAKLTKAEDFPDKTIASAVFTHDLKELAKRAGVYDTIKRTGNQDKEFERNWAYVNSWSEKSRYESHTDTEAEQLLKAVSDPDHGVLPCLKKNW